MTDPIERPSGAAEIHVHHHRYPLKDFLIVVFGVILVAVAVGAMGWLSGSSETRTGAQSSMSTRSAYSADHPIYVVLTVLTDKPVTITPTPTDTMTAWEYTATAQPTNTPVPYQMSPPYDFSTKVPTPTPTPLPTPLMVEERDTEG